MQVTIYGSGYVGLVTGTCLAELGHHVLCVDIDAAKVAMLNAGGNPLYEPQLEDLLKKNRASKHIEFTTDLKKGVAHAEVQIIAVNTPSAPDGSANIQNVLAVTRAIGSMMTDYRLIINKSTAPVGTAGKIKNLLQEILTERQFECQFDVASNPEFLKEGAAVDDFMRPDRIIIGMDNERPLSYVKSLYAAFPDSIISMDIPSAELSKYAANAMLATKISFINEMANIAEKVGADIRHIQEALGSDKRIGPHFINPGCGYGGSCFPKDVKALAYTAAAVGLKPYLINAVEAVNENQKQLIPQKISTYFKGDLKGLTFALWGLAFKPNTNDMREASSCIIMESLWAKGARVQAYDPVAMPDTKQIYRDQPALSLASHMEECLEGADALIIATEWDEFKKADLSIIKQKLKNPVIFDGRNILDPSACAQLGITYFGIGR